MILDYLHTYPILSDFNLRDTNNLSNKITFVTDNCAGQNKNNNAIHLANLLIEGVYFTTVEIIFLVKGYTKNSCD